MDTLKLGPVFFGALEHPDYAWPNYFYYHQQQSVWTKGIYLTTLDEVYHACIMRIQMRFNATKRKIPGLTMDNVTIGIAEFTHKDNPATVDKKTLEQLHKAIHAAWYINVEPKTYTPIEILAFVEYALWFMRNEYQYVTGKTTNDGFRPRTKSYFNYLIAQDAPFFDFTKFKAAIRQLNLMQQNQTVFEATLEPFQKAAQEIVTLWNEDIAPIVHNDSGKYTNIQAETARVEFSASEMNFSWWNDSELFEVTPHKLWLCQDFAYYAAKITNLIMNEIFLPNKHLHRNDKKHFLHDLLTAIHLMQEKEIKEEVGTEGMLEDPYRNFIWIWFRTAGYQAERETLKGTGHIDLKINHPSTGSKVIEFKGWWNAKKKDVIQQTIKYLTEFEDEGYIFMINSTGRSIIDSYKKIVSDPATSVIDNLSAVIDERNSPYTYYVSSHDCNGVKKKIYHFIYSAQIMTKRPRKSKSSVTKHVK